MHAVIHSVYTISGNIHMGMIREGFVRKFKAMTLRSLEVLRKLKRLKPQKKVTERENHGKTSDKSQHENLTKGKKTQKEKTRKRHRKKKTQKHKVTERKNHRKKSH